MQSPDAGGGSSGDVADGRLHVRLDAGLAFLAAAPGRNDEPGAAPQRLLERVPGGHAARVIVPELQRAIEQVLLQRGEQRRQPGRQLVERHGQLLARIPAHDQHLRLRDVPRSDLDAQRDTPQLPLRVLPPRRVLLAVVEHDPHAGGGQRGGRLARPGQHGLLPVAPRYRHDHDLMGCDARRQDQAAVVPVRHDHPADQARGHAPGRLPGILQRLVPRLEPDVEHFREVLAEHVRRAGSASARPSPISASIE